MPETFNLKGLAYVPDVRQGIGQKTDAREVSRAKEVDLKYLYHCPVCFQLLTEEEDEHLRRAEIAARCTIPKD